MTDDDVKDLFDRLVADPPASSVDPEAAIRDGRRQHARKHQLWIGTAAAGALAAAATFSALTGGTESPDSPGVVATPGTVLPDKVVVRCTPDGIEVDATEIRTRPDGVAFDVSSTLPKGGYLSITGPDSDLPTVDGHELPTVRTTWVLGYNPGELVLSCGLQRGSAETSGTATIHVSDPDRHWHDRSAIEALGCGGGANADWIGELYQEGPTRRAAAQTVAEAFRQLDGNQDATFTVKEVPLYYADGVNQNWVAYRNGEPYVTILVNRDGDHFSAGPNDRCSGFDLSVG